MLFGAFNGWTDWLTQPLLPPPAQILVYVALFAAAVLFPFAVVAHGAVKNRRLRRRQRFLNGER